MEKCSTVMLRWPQVADAVIEARCSSLEMEQIIGYEGDLKDIVTISHF